MVIADKHGRYMQVNEAMTRILGYSQRELLSMKISDITVPGEPDQNSDEAHRLWSNESDGNNLEKRYLHKDGHEVWGAIAVSPVRDAEGKTLYTVGQLQDITGRKRLEEQLLQAQKMEAVGQLAGGVAHDFNNLLTAVLGYAGIAMRALSPDHPVCEHLREIQDAGERAASLTRPVAGILPRPNHQYRPCRPQRPHPPHGQNAPAPHRRGC